LISSTTKYMTRRSRNPSNADWQSAVSRITNHSPVADVRLAARKLITVGEMNAPYWREWSRSVHWAKWQNYYLGGPLHEEDSPGNYTIREVNGHLEFISYDAQGAEHIQTIGE
jgi:hypothetical protein